jgi:hypothetical protein
MMFSVFRRKPIEPDWQRMTLAQILSVLPKNSPSNESILTLLRRLDEIALFDADVSEQDRADATLLANAVEQDLVNANPQAEKAVAEARRAARSEAAINELALLVNEEADKMAAAIGAPSVGEILARLDNHPLASQARQGVHDSLDHAIANKWTPQRTAQALLFNLLGAVGENAAAQRLLSVMPAQK